MIAVDKLALKRAVASSLKELLALDVLVTRRWTSKQ
jgi:hypothetical protein